MLRLKVLISILWLVSSKQICPEKCSCQWKWKSNGKKTIDCTNKNFQYVPAILNSPTSNFDIDTEPPYAVAILDGNDLNFMDGIRLENLGYKFIQTLSFKHCSIEDLPIGLFDELGGLMALDLSQNRISSIENEYFNNLPNLATLDLSENQITHIAANAFTGLLKLKSLDLSANKINSLIIQDFASVDKSRRSLTGLTKLLLKNNPLKCDCYLGRLYAQLKVRKINNIENHCHNGEFLSLMEPEDFECGPMYLSSTPRQLKRIGENVTLQCKFEANPAPTIQWFFKDNPINQEDNNNPSISATKDLASITTMKSILRVYKISSDSVGDYTCRASNQLGNKKIVINVSQANALLHSTDSTSTTPIIVGVTVSVLVLVSVVSAIVYCIWIKKKMPTNQSSFAILNSSTSLPPMRKDDLEVKFTNPVPKPPRTGVYNSNFVVNSVDCSTLGRRTNFNLPVPGIVANDCLVSHYISNQHLTSDYNHRSQEFSRNYPDFLQSPELLTMVRNQPGSRSSVGTISTSVSVYQKNEYPSYPSFMPQIQRNQTHPPQNYARPGYVTLPRRPRNRPVNPYHSIPLDDLGPRTRGDGSSLHSIDSRLMLPPLNNINNNNNVTNISDKHDVTVGELDTSMSVTEVDESPPNRKVLDTIIEQD